MLEYISLERSLVPNSSCSAVENVDFNIMGMLTFTFSSVAGRGESSFSGMICAPENFRASGNVTFNITIEASGEIQLPEDADMATVIIIDNEQGI